MQESYSASGVPFSILDTLRSQMNGGAFKKSGKDFKDKTSGGVKSKNQFIKDRKLVLEAWKSFRKDVKLVKDKYLKDKIRRVERVLKSKQYGGLLNDKGEEVDENGNVINKNEGEVEEGEVKVEDGVEEKREESRNDDIAILKESIDNLRAKMDVVFDNLGINKDKVDSETAKNALKSLTEFVDKCKIEKDSESTFTATGGKSRSKKVKKGGNILQDQGQYAINNIIPDKYIGGMKLKRVSSSRIKKGGENTSCNNTTTFTNITGSDSSYNLLHNDQPFTSQYAQVPPELSPISSLTPISSLSPISSLTSSSVFDAVPSANDVPAQAPMDTNAVPAPIYTNVAPITSGGGKKKSKKGKKSKNGGNFGLPGDLHNILSPSSLTPESDSTFGGSKKRSSSRKVVK